jgi:hypothetical protein
MGSGAYSSKITKWPNLAASLTRAQPILLWRSVTKKKHVYENWTNFGVDRESAEKRDRRSGKT